MAHFAPKIPPADVTLVKHTTAQPTCSQTPPKYPPPNLATIGCFMRLGMNVQCLLESMYYCSRPTFHITSRRYFNSAYLRKKISYSRFLLAQNSTICISIGELTFPSLSLATLPSSSVARFASWCQSRRSQRNSSRLQTMSGGEWIFKTLVVSVELHLPHYRFVLCL